MKPGETREPKVLHVRLSAEENSLEARISSQRRVYVDNANEARHSLRAFLESLPKEKRTASTDDSATLEGKVVLRWRTEGNTLHVVAIPAHLAGSETRLAWWINALRVWFGVHDFFAWTDRASTAHVPIEGNWPEDDAVLFAASDALFREHRLTPEDGEVIQSESYFSTEARDATGKTQWTFHVDYRWPWFTEVGVLNVQDPWDADGEHALLTEILARALGRPHLDVIVR